MRNELNKALIALTLGVLGACGAAPQSGTQSSLQARIEAADEFTEGPSTEACQALEDQHVSQKDLRVHFSGGDLFIPYDQRPFYMVENERFVAVPDGSQILYQDNPRVVFCTFEIQNGLVRTIQMGGI